jgi:hypothetical protein
MLHRLLTEINSLESVSSAWRTLRDRDYWSLPMSEKVFHRNDRARN